MKVKVKFNHSHLKRMKGLCNEALVRTADALKSDLQQSHTMPFGNDTTEYAKKRGYEAGTLQDKSTFVDDSKKNSGKVRVVSDTPYARRLYFHPEYHFYKGHNPNAGGKWFEPYISGKKKNFANKTFARIMRGNLK